MYLPMQGNTSRSRGNHHEYIYESQISILVSGLDDWVWTGYCFVDVYFDGSGHTEQVENYCNNARERMDPHSFGEYPADIPTWNPRQYFLRALSARVKQATEEWDNSVSLLMYHIGPYVRTSPLSMNVEIYKG